MANVNVTCQEMQAQATSLNNGRITIEDLLGQLKGQVQNLISGGFVTDTDSGALHASYESFSNGVSQTILGLDGMAAYLNKAAETFQTTDAELAKGLG